MHNRAELIDYLHKHPSEHLFFTENGGIQMATKRIMYNSDLTSSEKKAIRRYIESLSKETDTSKGLYYTDKKKGFIYWFNTSFNQYNDNRALGRDGFEIINKYDISNLSKQDKNAIDDELKQPKQSINRIITQFGLSQRINDDNIIALDYGEGENVIDSLDKQSPTSIRGTGDKGSRKNQREEFFLTPQGEIYGFMTKDGHMYLDENVVKPEHPIPLVCKHRQKESGRLRTSTLFFCRL